MRYIKLFPLLIVALLLTNSCKKNPVVSFTTDKTEYSAGQKVKLTNTSEKGKDYSWAMPDGTIVNTENAEYTIDPNTGFTDLKLELSAKARYGCRHHSQNLTVKVIPQSWFIRTSAKHIPDNVSASIINAQYKIAAYYQQQNSFNSYMYDVTSLNIYFQNNAAPAAGTYILQTSNSNLTTNTAFMEYVYAPYEATPYVTIVSGQIHVEYTHDKLHIYFTNTDTAPFSGDLYLNP